MGTTGAGDGAAGWPLRPFGPPPHKWERSMSVLDSGDGQAVADRDHDALQPGMLRDELVVRRDILRLLVLRCNDLAWRRALSAIRRAPPSRRSMQSSSTRRVVSSDLNELRRSMKQASNRPSSFSSPSLAFSSSTMAALPKPASPKLARARCARSWSVSYVVKVPPPLPRSIQIPL